jgi:hypothetical protein
MALALPQPAAAQTSAVPEPERLSDERTHSQWAYVETPVWARARPEAGAPRLRRLGLYTEHGSRELVLALSQLARADGGTWVEVRLPMRPANHTGWVPRESLGRLRTVETALNIRRRRFRATLYRSGRAVWRARVGVGKTRWPTPRGRFYIRERMVPTDPTGIYGVFAFGTSAYSPTLTDWPGGGIVGIHGTNQPGLIPGRISHGCVRVRNRKIARLQRLMPLGTPVRVR